MEHVFSGHGVEIHRQGSRYFLTFEDGEIAVVYGTIEILQEEAMRAQESEEGAYWVIIHYKNVEQFGEEEMKRHYEARGGRPMYDPIPR